MKKRFLAMLLSVAMVLTMLPVTAFAVNSEADFAVTAKVKADEKIELTIKESSNATSETSVYVRTVATESTKDSFGSVTISDYASVTLSGGVGEYTRESGDTNGYVEVITYDSSSSEVGKWGIAKIQEQATGLTVTAVRGADADTAGTLTVTSGTDTSETTNLYYRYATAEITEAPYVGDEVVTTAGEDGAWTAYEAANFKPAAANTHIEVVVATAGDGDKYYVAKWGTAAIADLLGELTVSIGKDNAISVTGEGSAAVKDAKLYNLTTTQQATYESKKATWNTATKLSEVVSALSLGTAIEGAAVTNETAGTFIVAVTVAEEEQTLTAVGISGAITENKRSIALGAGADNTGEPTPAFAPHVHSYTYTTSEESVYVKATGNTNESATIKSGASADAANTEATSNAVTLQATGKTYIVVTFGNEDSDKYVIEVTKDAGAENTVKLYASSDTANATDLLADKELNAGKYEVTLGENEESVKVVTTKADNTATVEVTAKKADNTTVDTTGGTVAVGAGEIVTITVTFSDDQTNPVVIAVTRPAAGSGLVNLTVEEDSANAGKVKVTAKTAGVEVPSGLKYAVLAADPKWSATTTAKTIATAIADSKLKGDLAAETSVPAAGDAAQYLVVYKVGSAETDTLEAYGVMTIAAVERSITVKATDADEEDPNLITFDANTTEYSVIVGKDVESITVTVPATATITGGTSPFAKDAGKITEVTVTFGEGGTSDVYTISLVWPMDNPQTSDATVTVDPEDDVTIASGTATLDLDTKTDEVLQTISNTKAVNDNADPGTETVPVTIPATTNTDVTKTEVTLPTAVSDALISSEVPVQIETNAGTVTLPSAAIDKAQGETPDVLTVVVEDTTGTVAETDVVRAKFKVTVEKNGEETTSIKDLTTDSMITLSFPVADEDIEGVEDPQLAWLKAVGEYVKLTDPSSRPGATGFTIFTAKTSHLSDFVVVGKAALEPEDEVISITVKSGDDTLAMTPAFDAEETVYTVTTDKTSATIMVEGVDPSKVTVDGDDYTAAGATIDLTDLPAAGKVVEVVYTATTGGAGVTYKITFKKATTVSEPLKVQILDAATDDPITIKPEFDPSVSDEPYTVETSADSVKIVVSGGEEAKVAATVVEISGKQYPLTDGAYELDLSDVGYEDETSAVVLYDKGASADGHTNVRYKFNFKKTAVEDTEVPGDITITDSDTTIPFDPATKTASVTLTASQNGFSFNAPAGATVAGSEGITVSRVGNAYSVTATKNGTVTITLADGTTTYTINVTKEGGTTPDPTGEVKQAALVGGAFKKLYVEGLDQGEVVVFVINHHSKFPSSALYLTAIANKDGEASVIVNNGVTGGVVWVYPANTTEVFDGGAPAAGCTDTIEYTDLPEV